MKIMESIEILSRLLKFLGWLSIILAILFLIQATFIHTVSLGIYFFSAQLILTGLVSLGLAHGLLKKEKWAWYTAFVIFILALLSAITQGSFIEFSVAIFISISVNILCLGLLVKGKQPFIKQPKEKISQWFHKPYFVMVIVGTLLLYLISGGFLVWQYFGASEEETKSPESEKIAEIETADWRIYTNEEYKYEIKYPKDWIIENKEIKNSNSDSYLFISQLENKENLTLNEWFDKSTIVNGRPTLLRSSDDTVINGLKAKILQSELGLPNPVWHIHIADKNNGIFSLYAYASTFEDKHILDQMLSSFKFVE